jgi:pimeloyl-ACP methyl ester carboxylesterase
VVTGRYDYTDPFMLTEQYFSKITAPEKHIAWFEESAHFPFYEEPAAFARQMRNVLTASPRPSSSSLITTQSMDSKFPRRFDP